MIRISEFAKMGGVSAATLRLYDEQGLLKPQNVDESTGYRSYTASQLVDLQRITMLKDLGFTLREINSIMHEGIEPDGLANLLTEKSRESEAQLQIERQKMKRLELQIQIIKGLQTMNTSDVKITELPAITAASLHLTIPTNDLAGPMLGNAFDHLYGGLHNEKIEPTGPCLCIWHSTPDEVIGEVVDVLVPVSPESTPSPALNKRTFEGGTHASLTHKGPFEDFQTCHIILKEWLAANAYRLSGPYREVYHTPPGLEAITEVQYPIEHAHQTLEK